MRSSYRNMGLVLLVCWTVSVCFFEAFPRADIWVTGLFYSPEVGFTSGWLDPVFEFLRQRIWNLSVILALGALAMIPVCAWLRRPVLRLGLWDWTWIMSSYLLGPVILVNGVFKAYSGRARPAKITEFGGTLDFSPPWKFVDQCSSNCSFVSGEAAAAVILSVGIWFIAQRWCGERGRSWAMGWAWALSVFVVFQRLVTGRHFLSDVLFAALISLSIAWLLWGLLKLKGRGVQS